MSQYVLYVYGRENERIGMNECEGMNVNEWMCTWERNDRRGLTVLNRKWDTKIFYSIKDDSNHFARILLASKRSHIIKPTSLH